MISFALDDAALRSSRTASWSAVGWTDCLISSIGRLVTPGASPPQLCAACVLISASASRSAWVGFAIFCRRAYVMGMMRQPVPVPVPETDMEGSKVQTKGRNGRWRDNGRGKCTNHNVSANLSHDRAFQILWFDINAGATRSFQPRSARCLPLRYAASAPSQRLVCAPCCCQAPEFVSTLRCRTPIELRRRKNRRRSGVEIGAPTRSRPFLGIKLRGNLFPRPVPPCSSC